MGGTPATTSDHAIAKAFNGEWWKTCHDEERDGDTCSECYGGLNKDLACDVGFARGKDKRGREGFGNCEKEGKEQGWHKEDRSSGWSFSKCKTLHVYQGFMGTNTNHEKSKTEPHGYTFIPHSKKLAAIYNRNYGLRNKWTFVLKKVGICMRKPQVAGGKGVHADEDATCQVQKFCTCLKCEGRTCPTKYTNGTTIPTSSDKSHHCENLPHPVQTKMGFD